MGRMFSKSTTIPFLLYQNSKCIHEEAENRMILHPKHASNSYDRTLITNPDSDVFVLCGPLQN